MKSKKSKKSKKAIIKKKKKIILICLVVILLSLIVVGLSLFSILTPHELNSTGLNTIYTNENKEDERENRFMVLNPSENEVEPENPTGSENNENNTAHEKPKVVDAPYYIKVNNQANVVTVYKKDKNGNYTVPVRAMICSIGDATPSSGVYAISDQYTWRLLERKCIWAICFKNYRFNTFPFSSISKER